jgi:tetratricopeptide (TPR) repeat protein
MTCCGNESDGFRSVMSLKTAVTAFSLVMLVSALPALAVEEPAPVESVMLRQADWLTQAAQLERRGDWHGLLDWGRRWTQAWPANATAWFVLGRAYSKLHRYPEAADAYRAALRIQPGDIHALINLGNVYRESRMLREALSAYRDAARFDPGYVQAWHNLGLTFFALKGIAGVTQALQELHASDPLLAEAWRKLAIEYSLSRDQNVARKAIDVLRGLDAGQRSRMFEILFPSI